MLGHRHQLARVVLARAAPPRSGGLPAGIVRLCGVAEAGTAAIARRLPAAVLGVDADLALRARWPCAPVDRDRHRSPAATSRWISARNRWLMRPAA